MTKCAVCAAMTDCERLAMLEDLVMLLKEHKKSVHLMSAFHLLVLTNEHVCVCATSSSLVCGDG